MSMRLEDQSVLYVRVHGRRKQNSFTRAQRSLRPLLSLHYQRREWQLPPLLWPPRRAHLLCPNSQSPMLPSYDHPQARKADTPLGHPSIPNGHHVLVPSSIRPHQTSDNKGLQLDLGGMAEHHNGAKATRIIKLHQLGPRMGSRSGSFHRLVLLHLQALLIKMHFNLEMGVALFGLSREEVTYQVEDTQVRSDRNPKDLLQIHCPIPELVQRSSP